MDIEVVDWFFLPPKLRSEDDSVSKSPCHESLLSPIWSRWRESANSTVLPFGEGTHAVGYAPLQH